MNNLGLAPAHANENSALNFLPTQNVVPIKSNYKASWV